MEACSVVLCHVSISLRCCVRAAVRDYVYCFCLGVKFVKHDAQITLLCLSTSFNQIREKKVYDSRVVLLALVQSEMSFISSVFQLSVITCCLCKL